MKTNDWIVMGLIALFLGTLSVMDIIDTTKPVYLVDQTVPFNGDTYQTLEWVKCYVLDPETGISSVEFSWWQTGEPSNKVMLTDTGEEYIHTGVDSDADALEDIYEIWAYHFVQAGEVKQWENGTYRFHFKTTNNQGLYREFPGAPNSFNIDPLFGEVIEPPVDTEPPDYTYIPDGNGYSGPSTQPTGSGYLELPLLFFAIGAIAIVYGFTRKKVT